MLYGTGPWCCACCCWASLLLLSLLLLLLLGMDMGGSSTTWYSNSKHTTAQYTVGVECQPQLQHTGQYTAIRQTQYA
jgi:hypothetical protein